jgi:hypothetical protein
MLGAGQANRSPSVISLTDSDSAPDVDGTTGHLQANHSPSVISLTDSDSAPEVDGTTGHLNRPPSVISLTNSTPDIDNTVDIIHDAVSEDPDPSLHPIIGLGSKSCVCSRGDSLTNPIIVEDVAIWPGDFHVCDIAQCIRLSRLLFCQQRLATLFQEMFGVPYPSLTFKMTRKIWEAPRNRILHEPYIDYGWSE